MTRSMIVVAFLVLVACSADPAVDGGEDTTTVPPGPSTIASTAVAETTTTVSTTTTTTTAGPVDVVMSEGSGAVGSGQFNPRAFRLEQDVTYRFVEFVPPLVFTPPVEHWEVADYSRDALSLRWRGPSGFRPGTLLVAAFGLADSSVEESWLALEEWIGSELAAVDEALAWLETGTMSVGGAEVEWRELRTTESRPVEIISAPCVIDFPGGECVWFETTGRLSIVPVGGLTISVLVTEQLCDCELGGLPGRFDQDNELADWADLIETVTAALEFES